ncbi:MAG: hypothetical protein ACKPKQ_00150 [Dolichospermum sp.]
MSEKVNLKLDWCSYEAAKYACENWHYSKCVPAGKVAKIGVWENNKYIGCIIFGWGVNKNIGSPYRLMQTEIAELVRVALNKHSTPVTKLLSIALKLLKKQSPGLKLIISYADSGEGHHGGIYQGGNWIYEGVSLSSELKIKGRLYHKRTVDSRFGTNNLEWIKENIDASAKWVSVPGKHKYLFPLTPEMKEKILPLSKPYPKRKK